jgi:hypothetical protein
MILLSILYLTAIHLGLLQVQASQSIPAKEVAAREKPPVAQTQQQPPVTQKSNPKSAPTKARPGAPKRPTFRVDTMTTPYMAVSVHARKAPITEVTAEISKQLKLPVVLAPKIKQELVTTDFDSFPLEAAVRLLAPKVIIDYVITGGEGPIPSKKEAIAVYLMALGESPSREGPYIFNKSGAMLMVGTVYATEEEEKAAMELKKIMLQVTEQNGIFDVRAEKQYLTDVLQEIADKARIPFSVVTTDGGQMEIDKMVTWDIKAVTLEQLTRGWLPNGIRLYSRVDLQSYIEKPLRLTIERLDATQVDRIVTP